MYQRTITLAAGEYGDEAQVAVAAEEDVNGSGLDGVTLHISHPYAEASVAMSPESADQIIDAMQEARDELLPATIQAKLDELAGLITRLNRGHRVTAIIPTTEGGDPEREVIGLTLVWEDSWFGHFCVARHNVGSSASMEDPDLFPKHRGAKAIRSAMRRTGWGFGEDS